MHIVVATGLNSGDAEYKNMGDVSMLQAAVARLSELWPDARIEVLSDSAENLARYCPTATCALSRPDCTSWLGDHFFIGRFHRYVPQWGKSYLHALKQFLGFRWPGLINALTDLRLKRWDPKGVRENLQKFRAAISECDALVVAGSGGFADSCREWNLFILAAMAEAIGQGKTVAMFGQGIGPLSDQLVLSWARHVLPKVRVIGLRGTKGDREILEAVGVDRAKMVTTGDDAVEPAYATPGRQHDAIGVNLRAAFYSEVDSALVDQVGGVLRDLARKHHAALLPVPIAFHQCANDRETIKRLLAGLDDTSDGGLTLDTPQKLMEQVSRCKVVVTGAYHAAVFALAQGIPVVGLCNSSYYEAKFRGLAELFGSGCTTVLLTDQDVSKKLYAATEEAMSVAEKVRPQLLNSAKQQVDNGRAAYQSLKNLLKSNVRADRFIDSAHAEHAS